MKDKKGQKETLNLSPLMSSKDLSKNDFVEESGSVLQLMITHFLKYALILSQPELQVLILVSLILSLSAEEEDRLTPTLFVLQAGCINAVGIASILSGVALPWVVLMMIAQGAYLVVDAHRTLSKK